jgi:ribonuclease BN (tRNA processing enzyme)
MKLSERRWMMNVDIDECNCEELRNNFAALRTVHQEHHRRAYDDCHISNEEGIKTDPMIFFFQIRRSYEETRWLPICYEFRELVGIGI